VEETLEKGDVALLRIPVVWEKVTVMENLMEESTMVMLDVVLDWFVEATTAGSLASTTMRRMIAVSHPLEDIRPGLNGAVLEHVTMVKRQDSGIVLDPTVPDPYKLKTAAVKLEMDTILCIQMPSSFQ